MIFPANTSGSPCLALWQLCANDILDGVDEFIESISLLPEPEKPLQAPDPDQQHSAGPGEEEGKG